MANEGVVESLMAVIASRGDEARTDGVEPEVRVDADPRLELFTRFGLDPEATTGIEAVFNRASHLLAGTQNRPESRAALVVAADVLTALVLDREWSAADAERMVTRAAQLCAVPFEDARLSVFLHAGNNPGLLELPPRLAVEAQLRLLAALGPVAHASLWTGGAATRLGCLVTVGDAAPTRRVRSVARLTLERETRVGQDRGAIYGVPVLRWQRPFGALVVRTRSEHRDRALAFAHETAALLAPILERDMLLERNARRERSLIDSSEKRLVRLGFDLHDGPLQEVSALAADIRLAQTQIQGLSNPAAQSVLGGRLQDFEARVLEIDRSLRELALSLESKSVLEQPLGDVLRREIQSFERRTAITTHVDIDGDFAHLTATQRLTLFRVLQEALTNVREHSGAGTVRISLLPRRNSTELRVEDDGNGFEVTRVLIDAARRGRLGLVGISERVRMLGGTFDIVSRPGGSTRLVVALPLWRPIAVPHAVEKLEVG